jgi:type IV pilus biogenesis protein PilP
MQSKFNPTVRVLVALMFAYISPLSAAQPSMLEAAGGAASPPKSVSTTPPAAAAAVANTTLPTAVRVADTDPSLTRRRAVLLNSPTQAGVAAEDAAASDNSRADRSPSAPSALTRKQQRIDDLKKTDEAEGVLLSISEKQRRRRALNTEDAPTARGTFKVTGIEGAQGDLVATVRFLSGQEIEVRSGDRLPDGRTVSSVLSTGVSIGSGRGAQHIPITLSSGRAAPANAATLPPERILVPMGGAIPAPSSR